MNDGTLERGQDGLARPTPARAWYSHAAQQIVSTLYIVGYIVGTMGGRKLIALRSMY